MSGMKRCPEGYGVRSLRMMREAKARGMHLRTDGRVVLPSGKVAKSVPQYNRHRINLGIDGERLTLQTARVVCFLAHGEPPQPNSVADHINGNTLDDSPSNLRWASYSENVRNNAATRTKTREQQCVAACEGIEDPSAVPEILAFLQVIAEMSATDQASCRAVQLLARAEGRK